MAKEEAYMKRVVLFLLMAAGASALAFAAAGCGGGGGGGGGVTALPSSSCGADKYAGSGDPDYLIASDLPLQGASRSLTTQMADAIELVLSKAHWKAGDYKIGYQSCDDSTVQASSWDSAKCTANARSYANDKDVIGIVGTFNSG